LLDVNDEVQISPRLSHSHPPLSSLALYNTEARTYVGGEEIGREGLHDWWVGKEENMEEILTVYFVV